MFETSVVHARVVPRRRYAVLSVSLVAHTTAILGAVAISVATVDFPNEAPSQHQLAPSYAAVSIPPPLGNPNGGARPQAAPPQQQPKPAPAKEVTAPAQVPDAIIPAESNAASTTTTGSGDGHATGTVPGPAGVPWGDPNSVATDLDLPPATNTDPPPAGEKVYRVGGDVKPPRVLSRVEPRYPQVMIHARKNATVRIRCIVDRHGAVREIEVLSSTFPIFNDAAVEAMRQWRFAPGSLNGIAVDTVFELTVNFQVVR